MKHALTFLTCSFLTIMVFGQERNQADVSVTTVVLGAAPKNATILNKPSTNLTLGPGATERMKSLTPLEAVTDLKCSITIHNENDDDAWLTNLLVVLPVEVSVTSFPANATIHKSSPTSPFAGYITFDLGHMTVGQNTTVEFTFTRSKYGNKVGAYAYSGTPDPNPTNNYKEASY